MPASSFTPSHFDFEAHGLYVQGQKTTLIDYSGASVDLLSAFYGQGTGSCLRFGMLSALSAKSAPTFRENTFQMPEDPANFRTLLDRTNGHLEPLSLILFASSSMPKGHLVFWEATVADSECSANIVGLKRAQDDTVQTKLIQVLSSNA